MVRTLLPALLLVCLHAASFAQLPSEPANTGPVKLVAASWFGGNEDDEFTSAAIAGDGSIVLVGNSNALPAGVNAVEMGRAEALGESAPSTSKDPGKGDRVGATGFILRLSEDGQKMKAAWRLPLGVATIRKIVCVETGNFYLFGTATAPISFGGPTGLGKFIVAFPSDFTKPVWSIFLPDAIDFDADSNGEFVVLNKGRLLRFKAGAKEPLWNVEFGSHGDNRPGGVAISRASGVSAVTGYGMTRTGHEPYKDPYAYGFDRAGKQVWALWNPDPTKECGAEFGGNGLMADTTGMFCAPGDSESIYIAVRADGGNTVAMRDPLDPGQKLDPAVLADVFQPSPGFGFKGASMTSGIFRADALTGKLQKGTFMSAWLNPARANGLQIDGAAADSELQCVVGGSASGFKTANPWYEAPEGGYKGGGFLAVFDSDFKMKQAGYFPGSEIHCVAARSGVIVIAGSAREENTTSDKSNPGAPTLTYPVPRFKPLQPDYGGGKKDGWFAVFRAVGSERPARTR